MPEEKEKDKNKEKFVVTEVPTELGLGIMDTETNQQYSVETAICQILNDIVQIKKQIC